MLGLKEAEKREEVRRVQGEVPRLQEAEDG